MQHVFLSASEHTQKKNGTVPDLDFCLEENGNKRYLQGDWELNWCSQYNCQTELGTQLTQ